MPYLTPGIQSLPQELKDLIFDFAFTPPPPNTVVKVDANYRPPTYISICSTLRAKTAQQYYSSSVFMFDEPCEGYAWLASVPVKHAQVIQHIDPNPLGDVGMGFRGEVIPLSMMGGEMMEVDQLIKELRESWRPREGVLRLSVRMALREAERT